MKEKEAVDESLVQSKPLKETQQGSKVIEGEMFSINYFKIIALILCSLSRKNVKYVKNF